MGLLGILLGLGLLIWLAYRGWSVLLVAPAAALLAAAFAGEPLLAHWTQTFMGGAAGFLAQFFPLFLLGAVFGKVMDDSGSALAIARFISERLGRERTVLAVVLACALLTYGGVSLFVVAFALVPVADALFRQADIPHRLIPATVALGAFTFTMSALPGTPAIQNAIPMPFFGTTPFAAPGIGILAAAFMLGFGLWWLRRAEVAARRARATVPDRTRLRTSSWCASAQPRPIPSIPPRCRTDAMERTCHPSGWRCCRCLWWWRSTSP
jgi:H+/gluconate symporter-like permease